MVKIKRVILFLLAGLMAFIYYISVFDNISDSLVRLHIISNSNTSRDTEIKLMVRDQILSDMRGYFNRDIKREEVINLIPEIERSANDYLKSQGISYSARVIYENADIPRKEYNKIILPKGEYSAIKVILGDGGGENWWCVAYPPLCFTEEVFGGMSEKGEKALRDMVGERGFGVITSDIKYELKIVEISKKLFKKITG